MSNDQRTPDRGVIIPQHLHGQRLDHALSLLAPELSLRQRRRLWESHRILLDGRPALKGARAAAGQRIELRPLEKRSAPAAAPSLCIVTRTTQFAALDKPAGLPSAAIAGRSGPSVESMLPELFPDESPLLLNRLDTPTSGLVLVGFSAQAADRYRQLQDAGRVDKRYLALVHGRMEAGLTIDRRIDMARRSSVRVLDEADPDPARHTEVLPLHALIDRALILARIRRGARHQIRAHLAWTGHAIVGDDLYGPQAVTSDLHLHHGGLFFDGFAAHCAPDWIDDTPYLADRARHRARQALADVSGLG